MIFLKVSLPFFFLLLSWFFLFFISFFLLFSFAFLFSLPVRFLIFFSVLRGKECSRKGILKKNTRPDEERLPFWSWMYLLSWCHYATKRSLPCHLWPLLVLTSFDQLLYWSLSCAICRDRLITESEEPTCPALGCAAKLKIDRFGRITGPNFIIPEVDNA